MTIFTRRSRTPADAASRASSYLRSVVSLRLLSWALDVAPEKEKTSLAVAIYQHVERLKAAPE